jgi:signal transduction histidine kinase/CheY-like chemotaxis protein
MTDAAADKITRQSFNIEGLVSIFMCAAALGPMLLLLLATGAPLFVQQIGGHALEHWTLLPVLLVLSTAFLISGVFSAVLARQMRCLVGAAVALTTGQPPPGANGSDEPGSLSERFDEIQTVLFHGRRVALARIEELEHENLQLQEAAQAQSRFFLEAALEIRTPLEAIVSDTRIIQRHHDKNPEAIDRYGAAIISRGNRLVKLISDIVDIVKIESGALEWEEEELHPATVVNDAIKSTDDLVKQHELQLRVDVSDHLPALWVDRKRSAQVLENLLCNAVKFTPAHGRIDVLARQTEGCVEFTVRDTGVGISRKVIDHLFENGWAVPGHQPRDDDGGGLGLVLCRRIVTHYGGRIWANNGTGCGAEFHVSLPALAVRCVPGFVGTPAAGALRVLLLMKNTVLAECALRALRLDDIESRVCAALQDAFTVGATWTPNVIVVSPSFAWQLSASAQQRIRKLGVSHILMFSHTEGFVEVSPPAHMEPLLAAVARLAKVGSAVLVADDDPEYGSVIEGELSQAGYRVERAYNGMDALTAVADRRPAVLVLDLALAKLDGFRVLEEVNARGLVLPTIVLTALDDSTVEAHVRERGAAEVLRKIELVRAARARDATRVREILTAVLAANPQEVSREAGLMVDGSA